MHNVHENDTAKAVEAHRRHLRIADSDAEVIRKFVIEKPRCGFKYPMVTAGVVISCETCAHRIDSDKEYAELKRKNSSFADAPRCQRVFGKTYSLTSQNIQTFKESQAVACWAPDTKVEQALTPDEAASYDAIIKAFFRTQTIRDVGAQVPVYLATADGEFVDSLVD